jgi:diguanylate cyclase (GGDEF)-like protein
MAIVYGSGKVSIAWSAGLLLVVCLVTEVALGEPVVTTIPGEALRIERFSGEVELLEDPGGELGIADISSGPAADGFRRATPEMANVGFTSSAWWVRFTLRNPAPEPRQVFLRQGYPLIDYITFFSPDPLGGWHQIATGDRLDFDSRAIAHRDFFFPLDLPAAGERTFYLRYASQGPVDIHLTLLDAAEMTGAVSREQLAYGVYFGCVIMLLVWSGLVFLAVRDNAFLAYFAYVATFGLYMGVNTGLAFQYLWPTSPQWANTCLLVLLNVSLIAALHFSTTILRSRDYTPRLFLIARGLQIAAAIAVALVPVLDYAVLVRPVTFLILVSVIFQITLGVVSLLAGSRPARFFVIAWSAFLAGSIIFVLKNFGVLPHTFLTQHSWQVGSLLEMILLSMTLSSRMSELQQQSRTDPLTLLGNRRHFDHKLLAEFNAARQSGLPLALLVLDIDHFKQYNDRHGHAQGDEAIKLLGGVIRRHARKPFVACRYGGEEFCVILPNSDTAVAGMVAERLRSAAQTLIAGDLSITISVGYACLTGDEYASPEKFFEAADAAMYSAKQAGRNRVAEFRGRRNGDPPTSVAETGT